MNSPTAIIDEIRHTIIMSNSRETKCVLYNQLSMAHALLDIIERLERIEKKLEGTRP